MPSPTDTATWWRIRQALTAAYPENSFFIVPAFDGSFDVLWDDGPTVSEVTAICQPAVTNCKRKASLTTTSVFETQRWLRTQGPGTNIPAYAAAIDEMRIEDFDRNLTLIASCALTLSGITTNQWDDGDDDVHEYYRDELAGTLREHGAAILAAAGLSTQDIPA